MINKLSVLLVYTMFFTFGTYAQTESSTKLEETGIWTGLYLNIGINEHISYYAEHHYRMRNALDNVASFVGRSKQSYNRIGLEFHITDYFEIVVGPALIFNFSPEPGNPDLVKYTMEPRIWHQWLLKSKPIGRVKFMHQFRFEHRWKKEDYQHDAQYNFTNRLRYKLYAYIPLNNHKIQPKTWFISPSMEIFMQAGKSIVYNPFEDFRTYNGIGYVLNKNITFFAGHMWTLGQKSTGYEYKTSHVFRFNVYLDLNIHKLKPIFPKIN